MASVTIIETALVTIDIRVISAKIHKNKMRGTTNKILLQRPFPTEETQYPSRNVLGGRRKVFFDFVELDFVALIENAVVVLHLENAVVVLVFIEEPWR